MEKHEEIKVVYLLKLPTTSNDFIHSALAVTEHFDTHSSVVVYVALRATEWTVGHQVVRFFQDIDERFVYLQTCSAFQLHCLIADSK